jgi:hypothetical protein
MKVPEEMKTEVYKTANGSRYEQIWKVITALVDTARSEQERSREYKK